MTQKHKYWICLVEFRTTNPKSGIPYNWNHSIQGIINNIIKDTDADISIGIHGKKLNNFSFTVTQKNKLINSGGNFVDSKNEYFLILKSSNEDLIKHLEANFPKIINLLSVKCIVSSTYLHDIEEQNLGFSSMFETMSPILIEDRQTKKSILPYAIKNKSAINYIVDYEMFVDALILNIRNKYELPNDVQLFIDIEESDYKPKMISYKNHNFFCSQFKFGVATDSEDLINRMFVGGIGHKTNAGFGYLNLL